MIASAYKIKAGLNVNLTHAKFLCKPIAHNYTYIICINI